ncbi:uncharacterized protein LY79DRAFT_574059 [Colletotrichum navitas]|uniref:Lipocalin-like domain-containing protein n=1 Tax=Colletotrichum navitas TaxID=681940 RepID=A0AAD8PIZ7_9PEZI|nr:uncharacterized protein LY79DRAFT_574059 [Colletotrichum navitas]KAK1561594.1 hypothetical protein LY79DRAFT_574059 [Colletotrichum navitas]
MKCERALQCIVGGWGYLNATLTNTNTGELIPEWHSIYPSGGSVYAPSGHISFVITANDTTQADVRPKTVTLPAKPTDSDHDWALVAQHSLGVFGNYRFSKVTCDGGNDKYGDKGNKGKGGNLKKGPSGVLTVDVTSATLPSYVGLELVNTFEFTNDCSKHVLKTDFGGGLVQTVWFYRLPQENVFP